MLTLFPLFINCLLNILIKCKINVCKKEEIDITYCFFYFLLSNSTTATHTATLTNPQHKAEQKKIYAWVLFGLFIGIFIMMFFTVFLPLIVMVDKVTCINIRIPHFNSKM